MAFAVGGAHRREALGWWLDRHIRDDSAAVNPPVAATQRTHPKPGRSRRRLCSKGGIVDFGDLFAGDPAWDLAAAWVLLPAGTAARFFDTYVQADEAAIRRARGPAAMKSLVLVLMGQNGEGASPAVSLTGGR
ncbi:phosphotransferase [Nocardia rhamnosiphila]